MSDRAGESLSTEVLVVGGGPAGTLLAFLLARRGHEVVVIEKEQQHAREFRGETVAAPSVETLRALGFGDALDAAGYLRTDGVRMWMEGHEVFHVDYRRFRSGVPIDFPQPSMIAMFDDAAGGFPGYTRLMGTRFSELEVEDGRVVGAKARQGTSDLSIRARVVIGADGRFSKVRKNAGIRSTTHPSERDFLQFKIPRPADWGNHAELIIQRDKHLVVLPTYPDFLRIGANLPKGGLADLRRAGFAAFRSSVMAMSDRLAPGIEEHLTGWGQTAFLDIFTTEVEEWARDGLLLIGDAAHTCTPILGQGVNLAIQDAVTVTPVLSTALRTTTGPVPAATFSRFVADRRDHKLKVTRFQRMQEQALAQRTTTGVLLRRTKYRALDATRLKYRIFDGVLNARHEIAPEDIGANAPVEVSSTTER